MYLVSSTGSTCKEVIYIFTDQNERGKRHKPFENQSDAKCGLFSLLHFPLPLNCSEYVESCISWIFLMVSRIVPFTTEHITDLLLSFFIFKVHFSLSIISIKMILSLCSLQQQINENYSFIHSFAESLLIIDFKVCGSY